MEKNDINKGLEDEGEKREERGKNTEG